jgi:hypothetical protein
MNMDITLDGILASLSSAEGMVKSASDQSEEDKEKEAAAAKKAEDEKSKGSGEGKDKKDEKEGQEKSAAFKSGSDLAREIMEKVASTQIKEEKGSEMNKQASDAGKALAQSLMTKLAGIGDQNTETGIVPGYVPNKSQVDLAAQKAEHDKSFQATPGTDGAGNGGTINQIFDAIVADAQAQGVVSYGGQTPSSAAEGAPNGQAPNQVQVDESREKMAAAVALVNGGMDFDDAVDMVKAASDELEAEEEEHIKQAAFNELIDQGVDFSTAVEMIKEAGVASSLGKAYGTAHAYGKAGLETVKATGSNIARSGRALKREVGEDFKTLRNPGHNTGGQVSDAAKRMGKRVGIGAAAGAAGAAGVYAVNREKKAALDELVDQGVDFDTAVDLVDSASVQIYGF